MDSEKAVLASIRCLSRNYLLKKRREFNLEIQLAFLGYVKQFDEVKTDKLYQILQSINIPNLLLRSIIEIYRGNKIKLKINSHL